MWQFIEVDNRNEAATVLFTETDGVEQQSAELGVLPAVDEDVDTGVEHQEEVGAMGQDLAPEENDW
jgi:hypothetical protein